jgi:hypothetical protein
MSVTLDQILERAQRYEARCDFGFALPALAGAIGEVGEFAAGAAGAASSVASTAVSAASSALSGIQHTVEGVVERGERHDDADSDDNGTAAERQPPDDLASEHDTARAIRDGTLPSPQRFGNILLIALRITGTGAAYRDQHDEYVWRDPAIYMNPEFLERCQGLPVIWQHPEGAVLNSDEFADRIVGTVALPYMREDVQEVWGIAKIYDAGAAKLLETEKLSTSPAVVLKSGDAGGSKFQTSDGSTVLIENKPYLLDSLAICSRGVWDKGGPAAGVGNDSLSRGDSAMATTMEDLRRQVDALSRRVGPEMCTEMRSEFVAAQSRADSVMRAIGDAAGAPSFMNGERLIDYRARLLKPLQKHSAKFRNVDLSKVGDPVALSVVEDSIFADAVAALRDPATFQPGEMRAVVTVDPSGRPITRYVGHPSACWDRFAPGVRHITRFNTAAR